MSELDPTSQDSSPRRFRLLRNLGKGITLLRNVVLNVLFLVVVLLVLVATFSGDDVKPVPGSAVLVINPAGNLVEQTTFDDPLLDLLFGSNVPIETSINDVLNAIAYAATDDRIQLVILDFSRLFDVDMAEAERIQNALIELKESGTENLGSRDFVYAGHLPSRNGCRSRANGPDGRSSVLGRDVIDEVLQGFARQTKNQRGCVRGR